jgi:hypothetical protein
MDALDTSLQPPVISYASPLPPPSLMDFSRKKSPMCPTRPGEALTRYLSVGRMCWLLQAFRPKRPDPPVLTLTLGLTSPLLLW